LSGRNLELLYSILLLTRLFLLDYCAISYELLKSQALDSYSITPA